MLDTLFFFINEYCLIPILPSLKHLIPANEDTVALIRHRCRVSHIYGKRMLSLHLRRSEVRREEAGQQHAVTYLASSAVLS